MEDVLSLLQHAGCWQGAEHQQGAPKWQGKPQAQHTLHISAGQAAWHMCSQHLADAFKPHE